MELNEAQTIQQKLLVQVKVQLDPEARLVDELSELFETSTDSAYRRIRLEKIMGLDEVIKLCSRYDLSFDEIIGGSTARVWFQFKTINEVDFSFEDYLEYLEQKSKRISMADQKEILYMANDIPLFHLMNSPELASFKLFFWQKTILNFESLRDEKFQPYIKNDRVNSVSRKLREHYYKIPSTEMFCAETIDISLRQINYYHEASLFEDDSTACLLCDALTNVVKHLRKQCEIGIKFSMEQSAPEKHELQPDYQVYYNEVLYTDTTILAKLDEELWSFSDNNGVHVMSTRDPHFFDQQMVTFHSIKKRSTKISGDDERARNRIFEGYLKRISQLKTRLESYM